MYNYIKNPIALHTGNQTYKENTMKTNPLGVRKGIWTPEEDNLLRKCIESFGEGKWHLVPLRAGLNRCRKSCRLRWLNYLKPNIKRGQFTKDEVDLIIRLHKLLGNRWSLIAGRLPGRTANDVKNYWNSHIEKKLATESLPGRVRAHQKSITSTNIVRPRPLTFSHLRPQCPWQQGTRPPETCQTPLVTGIPTTINNGLDPPYLCHEADDECRRWWSSLLQMARDNPQMGLHDDFCNLNQHGEKGDVEGFTDFSIDVDIWKLLSFEDEG